MIVCVRARVCVCLCVGSGWWWWWWRCCGEASFLFLLFSTKTGHWKPPVVGIGAMGISSTVPVWRSIHFTRVTDLSEFSGFRTNTFCKRNVPFPQKVTAGYSHSKTSLNIQLRNGSSLFFVWLKNIILMASALMMWYVAQRLGITNKTVAPILPLSCQIPMCDQ